MTTPAPADPTVAPRTRLIRTPNERVFLHVLVNTAAANITTSYLWFALTFWVYLETRSVVATGIIGGTYMLLLAVFSTFNNLIGGVYIALMDPYGLTLFTVEAWGIVFGVAATGFIVGGIVIARFGLGRNPIRTMLLVVAGMGLLGALFTIRDWWLLYAVGIWLYRALVPAVAAAEQTVIQKVVPYGSQGRVFGFAAAFESAAAPITAFLIAPIAELWVIPSMETPSGQQTWGWLLGDGEARGIALVFVFAGLAMVVIALLAFATRSYRLITEQYRTAPETPSQTESETETERTPAP